MRLQRFRRVASALMVCSALSFGLQSEAAAIPSGSNGSAQEAFSLTPVAADTIPSLFAVDGQLWLTEFDLEGRFGALARIESRTSVHPYTFRGVMLHGKREVVTPVYATVAPHEGGTARILMNWQTVPPIKPESPGWEGGLATVDPSSPESTTFVPAQQPGDPLYSVALSDAFRSPLTVAGSRIWSLQSSALSGDPNAAWALQYPFTARPSYSIASLPNGGTFAYPGLDADAAGNVWGVTWGQNTNGVAKIAPNGGLSLLPMRWSAWTGAVEAPSRFWVLTDYPVSGWAFAQMTDIGMLADANAGLPGAVSQPPAQLSAGLFVSDGTSLWALGELGNPSTLQAIRFRTDGAWSWYTSPFTNQPYGEATAGVLAGRTLYFGIYHWDRSPASLFSFDTSRLIEAKPSSVALQAGHAVDVSVSEARYSGSFVARVLTAQLSGNPACPLSVTQRSSNVFTISANATVPANCGVTFTDADGFGTAMVNVNLTPPT